METKAFRGCRLAAAVSIVAATVFEILALAAGGDAPHTVLLPVAASPVGMSAFAIFVVMATPAERTVVFRLIMAVATVVFASLYASGLGTAESTLAAGASIPATIFGYLLVRIARTRDAERASTIDLLAATTIIGSSALSMVFCLDFSTKYFNPIFDEQYIRIDELFGAQPSALVAALFLQARLLMWLCLAVYFLLPLAQAIVAAIEARNPRKAQGLGILPDFIVAAMIGYVLYALMPAIGPILYLGNDFPMMHVGADYFAGRSNIDLDPEHIRGAMPSLHITWAVLLYLATRRMHPYVRATAAVFLFLTFLATLGLGMHYLIDLIVALPLILLVRALTAVDLAWRLPERALGIGIGTTLLAGWVVLTRLDIDIESNRAFYFTAMAVTVVLPLFLSRLLDRAVWNRAPQRLVPIPA